MITLFGLLLIVAGWKMIGFYDDIANLTGFLLGLFGLAMVINGLWPIISQLK